METYKQALKEFEEGYLMMIPITIILQTAIGSAAVMYLLMDNSGTTIFELALCISASMAYNAAILGQARTKIVFNMLIATLLINISLIIINLL
ncbi:MAG: hypothetical protein ACPG45_05905 [Flavobacteriaceae bacterium]